jgi:hypothetical protein
MAGSCPPFPPASCALPVLAPGRRRRGSQAGWGADSPAGVLLGDVHALIDTTAPAAGHNDGEPSEPVALRGMHAAMRLLLLAHSRLQALSLMLCGSSNMAHGVAAGAPEYAAASRAAGATEESVRVGARRPASRLAGCLLAAAGPLCIDLSDECLGALLLPRGRRCLSAACGRGRQPSRAGRSLRGTNWAAGEPPTWAAHPAAGAPAAVRRDVQGGRGALAGGRRRRRRSGGRGPGGGRRGAAHVRHPVPDGPGRCGGRQLRPASPAGRSSSTARTPGGPPARPPGGTG